MLRDGVIGERDWRISWVSWKADRMSSCECARRMLGVMGGARYYAFGVYGFGWTFDDKTSRKFFFFVKTLDWAHERLDFQ